MINPDNPCRCPKKTRALVRQGIVDKNHLRFNVAHHQKISDLVAARKDEVSDKIQLDLRALFQDTPFQIKNEIDGLIHELVECTTFSMGSQQDGWNKVTV